MFCCLNTYLVYLRYQLIRGKLNDNLYLYECEKVKEMLFNESISKFISRLNKNDLLVLFSDTPPMFATKRRIHFEDLIDIYFISKK